MVYLYWHTNDLQGMLAVKNKYKLIIKSLQKTKSMKKLILAIALTLGLTAGFSSVSAAELNNLTAASQTIGNKVYITVYENGAIWVYVYEDGTFITKFIEQN